MTSLVIFVIYTYWNILDHTVTYFGIINGVASEGSPRALSLVNSLGLEPGLAVNFLLNEVAVGVWAAVLPEKLQPILWGAVAESIAVVAKWLVLVGGCCSSLGGYSG